MSDVADPHAPAEELDYEPISYDDHNVSDWFYVKIAAFLAVITGIEVAISYIDIGPIFLPLLLGLMTLKFFMVVLFFMHIRYDAKIFGRLFYLGLGLAVFVYSAMLLTFHFFVG
jgi:cytochrome c oxidase subunit 4